MRNEVIPPNLGDGFLLKPNTLLKSSGNKMKCSSSVFKSRKKRRAVKR